MGLWDCSGAGTKLRLGGSSGFNALSAGNHETVGEGSFFDKREPSIHFWTTLPFNEGNAWHRTLMGGSGDTVLRTFYLKSFGFSVRCIADPIYDEDGDGVNDGADYCPGTNVDIPTVEQGINRWIWNEDWITLRPPKGKGPQVDYTIEQTRGCNCTQILTRLHDHYPDQYGNMKGQFKFGCSKSVMDDFIRLNSDNI